MTGFCAYCGLAHERKSRCCTDWCERRVRGRLGWISRSRKIAHNRMLATIHKRELNKGKFRAVALGQTSLEDATLRIFGTLPSPEISDPSEGRP